MDDPTAGAAPSPPRRRRVRRTIAKPAATPWTSRSRLLSRARGRRRPLVVDKTFATPYLRRPLESSESRSDHPFRHEVHRGERDTIAGAVVDSGTFDWRTDASLSIAERRFAERYHAPPPKFHFRGIARRHGLLDAEALSSETLR
jgi:O-acetylhomoserine/O-acetylserine sulfhydrylase-like pyridoxal-dependent enzyme